MIQNTPHIPIIPNTVQHDIWSHAMASKKNLNLYIELS